MSSCPSIGIKADFADWQITALAGLLDTLDRKSVSLAKFHKEIADIAQSEAVGAYRNAQAGDIADKAARAKRKEIGGIAAAAANDPRVYQAMLMDPQAKKLFPSELTGNYATDRPMLQYIAQASIDADNQADNARNDRDLVSKDTRRKAASAASSANSKLAGVRLDIAREVLADIKKYGGDKSAAAVDAKQTASDAKRVATAAAEAKNFPAMPLNEKDIELNKTYTLNGKRYTAAGKNADGKMTFIPFEEGHARALKAAKAAVNAAVDVEPDNED